MKDSSQQDYYVALQNSLAHNKDLERRLKAQAKQKKQLETEFAISKAQHRENSEMLEKQLSDSLHEIKKQLISNIDMSRELNELKLKFSL